MKTMVLIISAFASSVVVGQEMDKDKDKVYTYNITKNDPFDGANNLSFEITPLTIDASAEDFVMGFRLGTNARISKYGMINFTYDFAYLDRIDQKSSSETPVDPEGLPISGSSPRKKWNLGGTVFFSRVLKDVEERLVVKSESGGPNTTINYVIDVPCKKAVLYGVNINLGRYGGQVSGNTGDGFKGYNILYPETIIDDFSNKNFSRLTYNSFKLGLMRLRISHLEAEIEDFGSRETKRYSTVFCNMILGFNHDIEDMRKEVSLEGFNYYQQFVLRDHNDFRPIGMELGFAAGGLASFGFNAYGKVGVRPGINMINDMFAEIGFGILINKKVW
ncbi:MAG: hypothetical protein ACI8V8_002338 [Chitinophagales bacterium]|jgi:hypothetical protein